MRYLGIASSLACVWIWLMVPASPGLADEGTAAVMARLKKADAMLAQGRVEFKHVTRNLLPQVPVEEQIAAIRRDLEKRGASQEQIAAALAQARQEAAFDAKTRVLTAKETLIYAPDKRYLLDTTLWFGKGETRNIGELWDGKDELTFDRNSKEVTIHPGGAADRATGKPVDRMIRTYPGACFILGRGLSALENVRVQRQPGGVSLEGVGPDGTRIKAMLDAGHDYVATRIERMAANGKLISRMLLGSPIRATGGPWVASRARYEAFGAQSKNGQPIIEEEYELTSADFTPPDYSVLTAAIPQGWRIHDER